MTRRWLCLTVLVLLVLSIPSCKTDTKTGIVGKWEVTLSSRRGGSDTKTVWEFLPDGYFTVKPWNDETIIDKDKYQVSADGRTVKFRSAVFAETTCLYDGSTMAGENETTIFRFKRL